MKTLKNLGLIIMFGILSFNYSCKKDENNGSSDAKISGPAIVIDATIYDQNSTNISTPNYTPIEGVTIDIYQYISNWNNYETPIYTGITDSTGQLVINNDTLINRGILDQTDLYVFAQKDSKSYANWQNIESNGKLYFDKRDSVQKQIVLEANDASYKTLSVATWNLFKATLSPAPNVNLLDTTTCLQDNYIEIKRQQVYFSTTYFNFIFNNGANICNGKTVVDTLVAYSNNVIVDYSDQAIYGSNTTYSINSSYDTLIILGHFQDAMFNDYVGKNYYTAVK